MGEAEIEERTATQSELIELGLKLPSVILFVARAILVDDRPVAYLKDVLPIEYLRKDDLSGSFHGSVIDVLLKRGFPPLSYSLTKLAAVSADPALSDLLDIVPNTPLMRLEARLFSQNNLVIDYSISHFIPGYFDFHVVRRIGSYP
jgi:GntR family transcriptional regulator